MITREFDKGKGPIFEFKNLVSTGLTTQPSRYHTKLLASTVDAGRVSNETSIPEYF